jgi:hypothetical protein
MMLHASHHKAIPCMMCAHEQAGRPLHGWLDDHNPRPAESPPTCVMCPAWPGLQISGQVAFFVALFRRESREAAFDALERLVPDVVPFLKLNGMTPAQVGRA